MAKLIIHNTHGQEDPERATLAFIVGNIAASSEQDVIVLLTIEGVWLATPNYASTIQKDGFPPLKDVLQSFVSNGGKIWVCGTCAKPRGIAEGALIEGATIVTAANVVEQLASGAATLDF